MIVDPSIPQPQPLPAMGVRSSDEILNHLDGVLKAQPPDVQGAIHHAHGILGLQSPVGDVANGSGSPAMPSVSDSAPIIPQPVQSSLAPVYPIAAVGPSDVQPLPTPKPNAASGVDPGFVATPSGGAISPVAPKSVSSSVAPLPNPHMAELTRLHETGSGASQIKNPFLKTLATIGDVVGSGLFPGMAQFIPGTSARNERLQGQEENQLGQEQKAAKITADVAQTEGETKHLGTEPPPTITTDKGIMQWNPETHAYDITAGKPAPKEEMEGKTVATAEGVMAWNPQTKKYDQKVGDAPEDKGAITHFLDKDGNAWKLNHDGSATPIKGPEGTQLQGTPTGPEGEKPLPNVAQMNKTLQSRWEVLHPGQTIPEHFVIPTNATQKDYDRIDKALESTERAFGTKAQQDQVNEMRRQTLALAQKKDDRAAARDPNTEKEYKSVHDDLNKKFATTETQLQNAEQAISEVNSGAMGQAFGTIKSLVALAGGQGSGVRITQAELNSIANARGIKGTFDGWLNGLEGKGKLSADQVQQLNAVLSEVKRKGEEKRALLSETLDKLATAKDVKEIRAIEKEYRDSGVVDPKVKAYADAHFNGDVAAAKAAIEEQNKKKK